MVVLFEEDESTSEDDEEDESWSSAESSGLFADIVQQSVVILREIFVILFVRSLETNSFFLFFVLFCAFIRLNNFCRAQKNLNVFLIVVVAANNCRYLLALQDQHVSLNCFVFVDFYPKRRSIFMRLLC